MPTWAQILIAAIGTLGPLAGAAVLLASHLWTRPKAKAETELVTAQTLSIVIEGLESELARLEGQINEVKAELAHEKEQRGFAQAAERQIRLELAETQHRLDVVVMHHRDTVAACETGRPLPVPPPSIAALLVPTT